jgi:hypothetical protein
LRGVPRRSQRVGNQKFFMDRDQISRELVLIAARIADARERITRHGEKVNAQEEEGGNADVERMILRACEDVLELHLNMQEKLKKLSRSTK